MISPERDKSLKEVSCVSCITLDASESWLVKFEVPGFLVTVSIFQKLKFHFIHLIRSACMLE